MSQKNEPSLKEQLAKLDELIAWFDREDFDLDEALKKFDESTKVTELIKERLKKIENKVTILKERFNQPAEVE